MGSREGIRSSGGSVVTVRAYLVLFYLFIFFFTPYISADLGPENVLVLVNSSSGTSQHVAKMYREYYPGIQDIQVLGLQGLVDCSSPSSTAADEIITRQKYDTCIAGPVRQHLLDNNLIQQIMVIVTTAGMPYRIEDTNPAFASVIYPGGSSAQTVVSNESMIDAASVESELTCLWYLDYGENSASLQNRMVNPYQACRSSFDLFGRSLPDATGFRWTYAFSTHSGVDSPTMEGYRYGYGAKDRLFGPGHIYLTCRLDGPKNQGDSAVFAVRKMLERSKRASDPTLGVNFSQAAVVLDDSPFDIATGMDNIDYGRTFNLHSSMLYWEYTDGDNTPPDAYLVRASDDYVGTLEQTVNLIFYYDKVLTDSLFQSGPDVLVCLDYRTGGCLHQNLLNEISSNYSGRNPSQAVVAYGTFGCNGDDGKASDYLYCGGDDGAPMFTLVNGAIFTSLESFNAVTMFSDCPTTQAKIIDYIDIGGSGAIGHSFEPQADAAVDNEFLFFNFLADKDGDSRADLCFVEAAFSGIPYLSWTEVVIGDPLMRIQYNDQAENEAWFPLEGDVDDDGRINYRDLLLIKQHFGGSILPGASLASIEEYDDKCDVDKDGRINYKDMILTKQKF